MVVTWQPPDGQLNATYTLILSRDDGASWEPLATGLTGLSYTWTVSGAETGDALLRVLASDGQGVLGYDTSDETFVIAGTLRPPRPVEGVQASLDAGGLRLAWPAPVTDLLHGPAQSYRILHAASPAGPWAVLGEATSESFRAPDEVLVPEAIFFEVQALNAAGEAQEDP